MSQSYTPDPSPQRDQSSSTIIWIIVLVLVLVIGVPILLVAVMLLGCCGLGIGAYSAAQMTGEMARQQYGNHPVIQEHIGDIQSISPNFAATSEEQQKPASAGTSVIVFDVSGPKGSGQLIAQQQPGGEAGNMYSDARLRTSAGEFPLAE